MTDYTTLRVTEAAKEQAEESKREDETWNDYILRCTKNPPEVREYVPADAVDGNSDAVTLEASERNKIAEEVVGRLR